jgi:pyruvate,water dikinase
MVGGNTSVGDREMASNPLMSATDADRYWTSTNTGEALQGVATPADWTFFSHGIELGGRNAYRDLGVLSKREVYLPDKADDSILGVFYGQVALNVDFVANLVDRMPGGSGDDFERDIAGSVRGDVARPGTDWKRVPLMAARIPAYMRANARLVAEHNKAVHAWWVANTTAEVTEPRALLTEALARYDRSMHHHGRSRFLLMATFTQSTRALAKIGRPEAAHTLTGAVHTEETRVMGDLWAVARGEKTLEAFLGGHGYHGPNEGALSSAVWREDPRPLELTVASMRPLTEEQGPLRRHKKAVADREALEREVMAKLPRLRRGPLRLLLRLTRTAVANLEAAKAGTLMSTDVGRHAIRALGVDMVKQGTLAEPDDVFYLTMDELTGTLPADVAATVELRRRTRAEYLDYDLPVYWAGVPTPVVEARDVESEASSVSTEPVVLTGLGVSAGTYEGIAYVLHDPGMDGMEPGAVLIARVTDPSWMVALSLAGAVVLDIGGPASHGAIVAREFGVPCVVNTKDGTRRIQTGDRVLVRADEGIVEVLKP